ncbi:non-ribosomal peptide synthetase, partial [Serratia rubidaea]|uniref:non-ribosomal peptide synthetase n=1 Tax=Serratia rubidaea TaxID=61652 RepID=UPI00177F7838
MNNDIDVLLNLLKEKNIRLHLEQGELVVRAARGAMDPQMVALLKQHKARLVEALQDGGTLAAVQPAGRVITPEMLTLVTLSQASINTLLQQLGNNAANIQDIYPLAPLQEGILFHHLLHKQNDSYLLSSVLRFDSKARLDAFLTALQQVVDRHDILRTVFVWEGLEQPVQVVLRQVRLPVETVLCDAPAPQFAQSLEALHAPQCYPMDIRQAPLMRCFQAQDPQGVWHLHFLRHHLINDHSTLEMMIEEIRLIEHGGVECLPEPIPFRNFIAQVALAAERPQQEAFFRRMLGDITEPSAPFAHLVPQARGQQPSEYRWRLDAKWVKRIRRCVRREKASLASLMHLAWALVVARTTGKADVVFGTVLFGRMQGGAQMERVLGMLINTLPIRITVDDRPVSQALKQTQSLLAELLQYEHTALAQAQKCSGLSDRRPLFTTLMNYRHSAENSRVFRPEQGIEVIHGNERTDYPLSIDIDDFGEEIGLTLQAMPGIDPARISRFMEMALRQLTQALEQASAPPLNRLDVLPALEQRWLLDQGNTAQMAAPAACLHRRFEAQVRRTPHAIALIQEARQYSYTALNEQANQLARRLVSAGVGAETCVALYAPRSPEMVIGILAILKAGGAYVPLDPAYPPERLAYMLHDSHPVALLKAGVGLPLAFIPATLPVFDISQQTERLDSALTPDLISESDDLSALACLLYTSGTTGQPKGVMIEHRSVVNQVDALAQRIGLTAQDRMLQFAALSFDASLEEIFATLFQGATLVLRTDQWLMEAAAFWALCRQYRITLVDLPTQFWSQLALERSAIADCVRQVIIGGEAARDAAIAAWFDTPGHRPALLNTYGPTETTISATMQEIERSDIAGRLIGRPSAGVRLYVLDAQGRPAPVGVAGELFIGGVQVARGYLNRPELTAERFIADPFIDGGRLYRTGDLGRWRADGALEYLGRNDGQVKLRGFRIEPGEIEAQLAQVDGIREAVVVLREDSPGERRLAAYYTGEALEAAQLRREAEARLPGYMVPAAYVHLAALPLTANGKLDRRALPVPEGEAYARQAWAAPEGETERTLAQLWQALLPGVERVGRHDNFFELGGHSLLAVRLVSRLRQTLAAELALSEVFNHPTLCDLAARIAQSQPATLSAITRQPRGESLPLSLAQQRLWFLAQMAGVSESYHISGAVRLTGELNVPALEQALAALLQRHEALRTLFKREDDAPRQVIVDAPLTPLAYCDLRNATQDAVKAQSAVFADRRFALDRELPLRLQLLQTGEQAWLLQMVMHHIAADGWSMGIFLRELSALYNAALNGEVAELPALPVQYADYAVWQREWLAEGRLDAQLAYWRETLADAPVLLELPLDRPRPAQQSTAGDSVPFTLGAALSRDLKALSQRYGVTLYMTLLAGWAVLLSRLSGQEEVMIGTPVAGREREEVEGLIGFFVNTLALRLAPGRSAGVGELLAAVREQVLAAQAHQALPFDQVVEALQPPRSL